MSKKNRSELQTVSQIIKYAEELGCDELLRWDSMEIFRQYLWLADSYQELLDRFYEVGE